MLRRVLRPRAAPIEGRVAVVLDVFLRQGMAQAVGLKESGADVVCYYVDRLTDFNDSEAERQIFLDWAASNGVELVRLPRRDMRRFLQQTISLHRELGRRRFEWLVVHSHIDPRHATLGLRFPVAFEIHDPQPHTGDGDSHFPAPVRGITRFAELTSSCLVLHSANLTPQLLPSLQRLPLAIVPLGAHMERVPLPVPNRPSLLLVGRLLGYKGVDTALAAFPAIAAARPDCKLVFAGNGDMAEAVRGIGNANVVLHDGYVTEEELEGLFAEASLVLLPYKDATQSGVGLQAIGHGVPCIVTRTGGLPDLVPAARQNWVVPVNDPRGLADAVLGALDHDTSVRDEVFAHAAGTFAWPVAAARLVAEVERLVLEPGVKKGSVG